ncbi:hypothetical protein BN1318_30002 [Staphylococcus capitis]|nr:hypothetical protein BN1318_30002 [Staphylococcus capitis]
MSMPHSNYDFDKTTLALNFIKLILNGILFILNIVIMVNFKHTIY